MSEPVGRCLTKAISKCLRQVRSEDRLAPGLPPPPPILRTYPTPPRLPTSWPLLSIKLPTSSSIYLYHAELPLTHACKRRTAHLLPDMSTHRSTSCLPNLSFVLDCSTYSPNHNKQAELWGARKVLALTHWFSLKQHAGCRSRSCAVALLAACQCCDTAALCAWCG